jgi:predicted DNA-binding protein
MTSEPSLWEGPFAGNSEVGLACLKNPRIGTMRTMCYTHHSPMAQMIRKHFLLPLPLDERIKLVARQDHKSEAEVIRELLETGLETKHQHTGSVGHALRKLAEIGKEAGATGPTDLSQNIDKYLYEDE